MNRATHGVGRWQPEDWEDAGVALGNDSLLGVHMPKGHAKEHTDKPYNLYYNEVNALHLSSHTLHLRLAFSVHRLQRIAGQASLHVTIQDMRRLMQSVT